MSVQEGNVGTTFRLTVTEGGAAIDVSSATTKELIFEKPSGEVVAKAASLTTDGVDGQIEYASVAGDLDEIGVWWFQGHVILGDGSDLKTWRLSFQVARNIEA